MKISKPTAPIKSFLLQKMEPTSHLFLHTRFPAMILTLLVTELRRCQHILTINMEIAVSFNEIDLSNSHLVMTFSSSQIVEYQTESMTKPELKEVPQILENIPGRSITESFQK